ncbi:hypothetical protein CONLIGDRAFT_633257 [Coniochaeta ligniaria NRRL 30616]|uniref:Uncharacterized protein n=1 Tax=Coniochaeta ligniaria NRRL 30616 TaxID=1408157 RepID=A0A1J7IN92_9PEZI|nr:hypothetical protein CONLIGDRAFT_633257 [Coniochaeta ligniaria NRRL 30616]
MECGDQLALITSLPFVHTARRCYRSKTNGPVTLSAFELVRRGRRSTRALLHLPHSKCSTTAYILVPLAHHDVKPCASYTIYAGDLDCSSKCIEWCYLYDNSS